jgi:hypothetical protein
VKEALAWHHKANQFIASVDESRSEPRTAINLGCKFGVDTVAIANLGRTVTGLYSMEKAAVM